MEDKLDWKPGIPLDRGLQQVYDWAEQELTEDTEDAAAIRRSQ
jgi:nucleoside-diphosphate-sugar epimerase